MRRRWVWVAWVAWVSACNLGDLGQLVARLDVEATLEENSCGSAVGDVPDSTAMDVEVYERDGQITWVSDQGTFQASVDDDGNFAYSVSSQVTLREEEVTWDGVVAACVVSQTEEIRGTLVRGIADPASDAGTDGADRDPASVEATDTLSIPPTSGSDCSDLIGSSGFTALPCRVVVRLEGTEPEGTVYEP
jgi:hypothetical protein